MKRAIELRVIMQVDVPDDWDEEQTKFHLEDNHCLTNHVEALAAAVKADEEHSLCNLCPFAGATLFGRDFPLEEAFNPTRN